MWARGLTGWRVLFKKRAEQKKIEGNIQVFVLSPGALGSSTLAHTLTHTYTRRRRVYPEGNATVTRCDISRTKTEFSLSDTYSISEYMLRFFFFYNRMNTTPIVSYT